MMYEEPFRIKKYMDAKNDFGIAISHDIVFAEGGPLDGSAPGDITRWMAVPWQSDTSSCLSAYRAYAGEYLPTFWPARVPNDILTARDFRTISDKNASEEDKIAAFSPDSRKKWLRGFVYNHQGEPRKSYIAGVKKFVEQWHEAGIVVKKELEEPSDLFPKAFWVETGRSLNKGKNDQATAAEEAQDTYSLHPKWAKMNPRKLR